MELVKAVADADSSLLVVPLCCCCEAAGLYSDVFACVLLCHGLLYLFGGDDVILLLAVAW